MSEAPAVVLLCVVPNPAIDKTAEIERLEPGAIHRPSKVVALPGGKGLNVARAARHLGVRVEAILLLAGRAGQWVDGETERIGLPRRTVWVDGETRTCLSVLDRSTGLLTEFYEPGPMISEAAWMSFIAEVQNAVSALPNGTLVAISGSYPPGVSPEAAGQLEATARQFGGRTLVDTSGDHLLQALEARPYLVKVNQREAEGVVGQPIESEGDALSAAREIVRHGAERVIVTRGPDGAVGFDGDRAWAVDPPPGGGPYLVGSGDAFLAGVAAGLARDSGFDGCLRRGAAAAAASSMVLGQGELRRRDAARLTPTVRVRRLS